MRRITSNRTVIKETVPPRRTHFAKLAEDYDGIGQYVLVSLSGSSTGAAYKARLGSGDFGTGQVIPKGTPVTVFSYHGLMEILSMGAK